MKSLWIAMPFFATQSSTKTDIAEFVINNKIASEVQYSLESLRYSLVLKGPSNINSFAVTQTIRGNVVQNIKSLYLALSSTEVP